MKLLEDDVVKLRSLEPEDLDLLYAWENDSSTWRMGGTVSPYSRYALRKHIAVSNKDIYELKQLRLMIEVCGVGVGLIDIYDFDRHHGKASVGVLLDSEYRGRGYATRALSLVIDYAFSFLKLHQLYAYIPVGNEPSKTLFMRCGFDVSAVLQDWIAADDGFSDVLLAQRINRRNKNGRVPEPAQ
ncbi:MAG: GNAT family N-acetyltransferase [Tannerellaceae bacterium]|jgi:diamine N-acetyltransferase|nr:GNAT family N-acetyltransferase [Tannerellaceae bacterium]